MSVKEWEKVFEMSQDKNLYHNLCTSLFPTIHGKSPVVASEREDFTCENINSFCCLCGAILGKLESPMPTTTNSPLQHWLC